MHIKEVHHLFIGPQPTEDWTHTQTYHLGQVSDMPTNFMHYAINDLKQPNESE